MGALSRRKGAAAERELAGILRNYGFVEARRGQQFRGGGDSPDVMGLPGFHIESKRVESLQLYPALEQAQRDRAEGLTPLVVHRRNEKPWVAILPLSDFLMLVRKARGLGTPLEEMAE